jgi:hypothetical protein
MSGTPPSAGEPLLPHDDLGGGPQDELRDEIAHLQEAVRSQRAIGMAVGLLSATYGCSTEQAWRTMLRISQDSNTKVRTVARVLVAVHDGTAGEEDHAVLASFRDQLPASGWQGEPSA